MRRQLIPSLILALCTSLVLQGPSTLAFANALMGIEGCPHCAAQSDATACHDAGATALPSCCAGPTEPVPTPSEDEPNDTPDCKHGCCCSPTAPPVAMVVPTLLPHHDAVTLAPAIETGRFDDADSDTPSPPPRG